MIVSRTTAIPTLNGATVTVTEIEYVTIDNDGHSNAKLVMGIVFDKMNITIIIIKISTLSNHNQ